jgi:3-methylcrotonyl-CoA carboxylase alpha subunit
MRIVVAPVPGIVRYVAVRPRDVVAQGQVLFEMETLAMTQYIVAPVDGTIRLLMVQSGDRVSQGALLAEVNM